jgi:hypothetical protein
MSEKKLEECSLEDATHVEVNGKVYLLGGNEVLLESYHDKCIGIRWRDTDTFIPEELFSTLGIKPLKEAKPKPIEFEHIFTFEEISLGIIPCEAEGKRFRCVEISEEKK